MDLPNSESVVCKINEASSVREMISLLRYSFQQKEYDEVERLLMCREEKLRTELNNLKRDLDSLRKERDLMEEANSLAELNRLNVEQDLNRCKHECNKYREQLKRQKERYEVLMDRERRVERLYENVMEDSEKVGNKNKRSLSMLSNNKEAFDESTEGSPVIKKLISKKANSEEEVALQNNQLHQLERRVSILEEAIPKLMALDDLVDVSRGIDCEGLDMKIEVILPLSAPAVENSVHGVLSNGKVSPAFEGGNGSFDIKDLKNFVNDRIESENGGFGVDKLHNGSNEDLEKMTPEDFSNGLGKVGVLPRLQSSRNPTRTESPDLHIEGLTSTKYSSNQRGAQMELVVKSEDCSEAAASCIPVNKRPRSPLIIDVSDSEEESHPTGSASLSVFCAGELDSIGNKTLLTEENGRECIKDSHVLNCKRSRSMCDEIVNFKVARRETKDHTLPCHEGKGNLMNDSYMKLDMMSASRQQPDLPLAPSNLTIKQCQEKTESYGGSFHVHDNDGKSGNDSDDSSGDEDCVGFCSYMENVLAKFQRLKENSWKFAADMRSAFEKDHELCMKAVCALYRKKISTEKPITNSMIPGNQVFSHFDVMSGKKLAEYLIDGDPQNKLKKTVSEVQQEDPEVLSKCRDLAIHYGEKLFDIYWMGKDRFFRPEL